jgi:hypothetical protein
LTSSEKARAKRLEKFFNLTVDLWDIIHKYQGFCCAVCGKPQKSGKRLATDHSHKTGVVRGLLCWTCNRLLGRIERTYPNGTNIVAILESLMLYMKEHPATKALGREIKTFPGRFGTKRHRTYLANQKK